MLGGSGPAGKAKDLDLSGRSGVVGCRTVFFTDGEKLGGFTLSWSTRWNVVRSPPRGGPPDLLFATLKWLSGLLGRDLDGVYTLGGSSFSSACAAKDSSLLTSFPKLRLLLRGTGGRGAGERLDDDFFAFASKVHSLGFFFFGVRPPAASPPPRVAARTASLPLFDPTTMMMFFSCFF